MVSPLYLACVMHNGRSCVYTQSGPAGHQCCIAHARGPLSCCRAQLAMHLASNDRSAPFSIITTTGSLQTVDTVTTYSLALICTLISKGLTPVRSHGQAAITCWCVQELTVNSARASTQVGTTNQVACRDHHRGQFP